MSPLGIGNEKEEVAAPQSSGKAIYIPHEGNAIVIALYKGERERA